MAISTRTPGIYGIAAWDSCSSMKRADTCRGGVFEMSKRVSGYNRATKKGGSKNFRTGELGKDTFGEARNPQDRATATGLWSSKQRIRVNVRAGKNNGLFQVKSPDC